MKLLQGTRVVVLADRLTDFGGSILARLGADVVRVPVNDGLTDAQKAAWQIGMRHADEELSALVETADVILDDRRTTVHPEIDALARGNDRLVHVIVTGWPENAPQRVATDLTLMAQSGLMKVIGSADRPPLRLAGEQGYALTGIQAATAALMGLQARRRTGKGQRIALSALQSAALSNYREAVMYDWTGRIGMRNGNLLVRGNSAVQQVWPCLDGFVTWAMVDNPGMMRAVVRIMEQEGCAGELSAIDWDGILVADTDQGLIERWQAVFGAFFGAKTRAQLEKWSLENGWGLSPITQLQEVPDSPQMQARDVFETSATGRPVPSRLFAVHEPTEPSS
ncbi:CoA transferase [Roseibium sp.]|uniref:CoA transferase n=1 Tax=Roseibium sp. TaxID=1936156 RepID=UPI003A97F030